MSAATHRHRCAEWRDVKVHPQLDWLWGTCLEFYPGPIFTHADKDGAGERNVWVLHDESSKTCSHWWRPNCPFCGVALEGLLT